MSVDAREEFASYIAAARAEHNEKLDWMKAYFEDLTRKYKNVCKDLEQKRIARRAAQGRIEEWKRQFQNLQQSVIDGSFVLVLIDADAFEYLDGRYQDLDSARNAAMELQAIVKNYLEEERPNLAHLPITIKAFANAEGPSKAVLNVEVVQASNSLCNFATGFSEAHAMAEFVLVGGGKDRVYTKTKGVFEKFIRNPTCRHIVFGACHDNSHVKMLEEFAVDTAIVKG